MLLPWARRVLKRRGARRWRRRDRGRRHRSVPARALLSHAEARTRPPSGSRPEPPSAPRPSSLRRPDSPPCARTARSELAIHMRARYTSADNSPFAADVPPTPTISPKTNHSTRLGFGAFRPAAASSASPRASASSEAGGEPICVMPGSDSSLGLGDVHPVGTGPDTSALAERTPDAGDSPGIRARKPEPSDFPTVPAVARFAGSSDICPGERRGSLPIVSHGKCSFRASASRARRAQIRGHFEWTAATRSAVAAAIHARGLRYMRDPGGWLAPDPIRAKWPERVRSVCSQCARCASATYSPSPRSSHTRGRFTSGEESKCTTRGLQHSEQSSTNV